MHGQTYFLQPRYSQQHGATVLLYHPCAPLRERLVLSALARSCLSDYILTSHPQLNKTRPVVLVSWGCTLEISSVASSDVCDWLKAATPTGKKSSTVSQKRKYNLLLTWSAEQHKPKMKEPVRQCCQQIISSLPTESKRETFDSRMKERNFKEEGKIRRRRAVPKQNNSRMVPSQHALIERKTTKTSSAAHPKSQNMNVFPTSGLLFNMSADGSESSLESQTEALQPSSRNPDVSKPNQMKDNDVVDVKEREVDHKEPQSTTHPHNKNIGFNSVLKPQSEFPANPEQHPNPQPDSYLQNGQNCYACDAGEHCKCEPSSGAEVQASVGSNILSRTQKTDEAVWAAVALGFLLVLLALSVLHTRLYRNWRTMPSLYWHDPRQDYDSVADVIRRRLRLAKRRRKRSRRQECVLLPSSSSSDDTQ
ncbi:tumor protein p53-inducible protein 13 isoform X2 [Thalassophryne amazonica]|uniref:tumor protein p53-inducible protein 13 isoform X2 n=1 Tax=Thalassophryne amazonica TaxID=390379 RepID=UPI001471EE12|nr:tumor protein p53-inducible protein 13 isoform X2 [Thalassophryne amazonica]